MRTVIQRVKRGSVTVAGELISEIGHGYVILVGVGHGDSQPQADWLAEKIANLRVFEDAAGKMNLSVLEVGGGVLVVSQFTLLGDARKGNRPGFTGAAAPEVANGLYERYCAALRERGLTVATGVFRATMELELVNEGPVTILLDSSRLF